MSAWQAFVLGLVQGLGEFLPISSSGHLKLAGHFLGVDLGEQAVAFDVLLHVGTLGSMLVYFRADLARVLVAWAGSFRATLRRGGWTALAGRPDAKWGWLVCLTIIPTALVALALEDQFEQLSNNIALVCLMLLVTGTLNWFADWRTQQPEAGRGIEDLTAKDALICGLAQSVALMHGISRSGSTIAAGLSRGLNRDAAPRFAFLMAIPAIAGAALIKLPDLDQGPSIGLWPCLVGALTAGLVGYGALATVFYVVRAGRLKHFAWYCWAVGSLALVLVLLGF